MTASAGGSVSQHRLTEKQVLIAKQGVVEVSVETTEGPVPCTLVGTPTAWDTFSIPAHARRRIRNTGPGEARLLVMTAGDHRKRIEWDDEVVAAAAEAGLVHDASGFIAPRRFVDRAQR